MHHDINTNDKGIPPRGPHPHNAGTGNNNTITTVGHTAWGQQKSEPDTTRSNTRSCKDVEFGTV